MRRVLGVVGLLVGLLGGDRGHAQGTLHFTVRFPDSAGITGVFYVDFGGLYSGLVGNEVVGQLRIVPADTPEASPLAVGHPVPFDHGQILDGGVVVVPGVPAGSMVKVWVKAWLQVLGDTPEEVYLRGDGGWGSSDPILVKTGGEPGSADPPAELTGFGPFGMGKPQEQMRVLPVPAGAWLIANPFQNAGGAGADENSPISPVLASAPVGSVVYLWDPEIRRFRSTVKLHRGWHPNVNLPPGVGMILVTSQPKDFVFLGLELANPHLVELAQGFNLVGSPRMIAGPISTTLKYYAEPGEGLFLLGSEGSYSRFEFSAAEGWAPGEPTLQIGQAAWIRASRPKTWDQGKPPRGALTKEPAPGLPFQSSDLPATDVEPAPLSVQFGNLFPLTNQTAAFPIGPPQVPGGVGADFQVNLWTGTNEASLTVIDAPAAEVISQGEFNGGVIPLNPGPSTNLVLQIRAWPRTFASYADAERQPQTVVFASNLMDFSVPAPAPADAPPWIPSLLTALTGFRVRPAMGFVQLPFVANNGDLLDLRATNSAGLVLVGRILSGPAMQLLEPGQAVVTNFGIVRVRAEMGATSEWLPAAVEQEVRIGLRLALQAIRHSREITLRIEAPPGLRITLTSSTNLKEWTPIAGATAIVVPSEGTISWGEPTREGERFYRAQIE